MHFLYLFYSVIISLLGIKGESFTTEPQSLRTGRLHQFIGYGTPQPLPTNAQYLYSSIWAAWSAWSICVNNYRVRVRACNTVKGFSCLGKNMEQVECSSTNEPAPQMKDSDYDVVDPWEEDRKEALKQLYPDYMQQQTEKLLKTNGANITANIQSSWGRLKSNLETETTTQQSAVEASTTPMQKAVSDVISSPELLQISTESPTKSVENAINSKKFLMFTSLESDEKMEVIVPVSVAPSTSIDATTMAITVAIKNSKDLNGSEEVEDFNKETQTKSSELNSIIEALATAAVTSSTLKYETKLALTTGATGSSIEPKPQLIEAPVTVVSIQSNTQKDLKPAIDRHPILQILNKNLKKPVANSQQMRKSMAQLRRVNTNYAGEDEKFPKTNGVTVVMPIIKPQKFSANERKETANKTTDGVMAHAPRAKAFPFQIFHKKNEWESMTEISKKNLTTVERTAQLLQEKLQHQKKRKKLISSFQRIALEQFKTQPSKFKPVRENLNSSFIAWNTKNKTDKETHRTYKNEKATIGSILQKLIDIQKPVLLDNEAFKDMLENKKILSAGKVSHKSVRQEPENESTSKLIISKKNWEFDQKDYQSKKSITNSNRVAEKTKSYAANDESKDELINSKKPSSEKAMDFPLVPQLTGTLSAKTFSPVTKSKLEFTYIAPGEMTVELKSGKWSEWSSWGQCLCGKRVRTRNCTYEPFMTKGCEGRSFETDSCSSHQICSFLPYRQ